MTFIDNILLMLFLLVVGPISVYYAAKLGTWAHYRSKYLFEKEIRRNEEKQKTERKEKITKQKKEIKREIKKK